MHQRAAGHHPGAHAPGPPALLSGDGAAVAANSLAAAALVAGLSQFFPAGVPISGGKSRPAAAPEIPPGPGRAVSFFCQRRGQTARGPGGEPGAAGIYGAGRLRPHGDRAGGDLQPAGGSPPGVGGPAPGGGGSQDSPPRRGRRRRGPHPGRQRHGRVFSK